MRWDWIAETDEHSKWLHTARDWVTVSVRAIQQRKRCGSGCPLAPLLFALAIEPLSRMLKQTMTGMQIDHIHVKQHTTHTVVAMCADDTTIFAGGLDDITHAKEAIQCYMDTSSASIHQLGQDHIIPV